MFPEVSSNICEGTDTLKNPITDRWENVDNIIRDILVEIG
jgi:hypothetical protein